MENSNRGKTIGNQTMSGKNAIMERNGKDLETIWKNVCELCELIFVMG